MRILITNDDGFEAPGISALYRAMSRFGVVSVVAPRQERSMCSHSIQLRKAMAVEAIEHAEMGRIWTVDAWPADCVRVALSCLLDFRPDWVVSGINGGANLGVDVFYSGTVAAAREAAINGIPAIAFSQIFKPETKFNWPVSENWAAEVFSKLSSMPTQRPAIWNVTFPLTEGEESRMPEIQWAPLSLEPLPLTYQSNIGPHASPRAAWPSSGEARYTGDYFARPRTPGSDVEAVFSGKIAVTPIDLDSTATEYVGPVRNESTTLR